jgi:hypothetical protein
MVYGLYRALPGAPGFLATVTCAPKRKLDTSVGVSGPHVFSVRRKVPSSEALPASTASRPAFVTIAKRPSSGTGRRKYATDLGRSASAISEIQKIIFARSDTVGQHFPVAKFG